MNKRELGGNYEEMAAEYLEQKGCRILERNFRCRLGEIDLIAEEDGCILFVEVKYRSSDAAGSPFSAVGYRKQKTISKVASYYLISKGLSMDTKCRFDVAGITPEGISYIENAFYYVR